MKKNIAMLTGLVLFLSGVPAFAHDLWLNVDNYFPGVGETVEIEIGFGHKFPVDETIKEDMLKQVTAVTPAGDAITLEKSRDNTYRLPIREKGTYLVKAEANPGFFSKTTKGYQMQNKIGLEHVIQCVNYDMRAKAFLFAGGKEEDISRQSDPVMEIIPLRGIKKLKKGDELPAKVFYRGNPVAGAMVYATYAGFSSEKESFAFAGKTDADGKVVLKLSHAGNWMAKLMHELPYPDKNECDVHWFKASFTFPVRP